MKTPSDAPTHHLSSQLTLNLNLLLMWSMMPSDIDVELTVTLFLHCSSYHSAGSRLFSHVETVSGVNESGCHEVLHKLQKWNQHHPGEMVDTCVLAASVMHSFFKVRNLRQTQIRERKSRGFKWEEASSSCPLLSLCTPK